MDWKEIYMKKTKTIALILFAGLLLTGCGKIPTLENGQQVVASVDGKSFTAEELYQELKGQGGNFVLTDMIDKFIVSKEIKDTTDAKEYAKSQVDLIKAQYASNGGDFEADLKAYGYESVEQYMELIQNDYMKQQVVENFVKANFTDKEIDAYYKDEIFGELTVKHILITPDVTDDMTDDEKSAAEKAALDKAKKLIADIKGGTDFEKVAKENSDDEGSAANGGLVADFAKNTVVEPFWNASYKLKDGEMTSEPVKSTYGYHIILRVSQKEKPAKEDVLDTIKDELYNEAHEKDTDLFTKSWVQIRKKYNLDIVDSEIKKEYNESVKDYE